MNNQVVIVYGLIITAFAFLGMNYSFNLNQYHEECYEYEQVNYIANYSITTQDKGCFLWCMNCPCTWENRTVFYNSTKNGECFKYILVREESK